MLYITCRITCPGSVSRTRIQRRYMYEGGATWKAARVDTAQLTSMEACLGGLIGALLC